MGDTKKVAKTEKTEKTEKPISYECVRCGFKTDTSAKMQVHINRS